MTMWGKFIRRREMTGMQLERIPMDDGDEITVASSVSSTSAPILLLLHGLEGGVRSHYVGGIWAVAREKGWQTRMLLFRTCDGRLNRARRTYHSGETTDLDFVVRRLIEEDPTRAIGLAGVSLGGNVMLKWLGEQGESAPRQIRAAIAVSTPYDLASCGACGEKRKKNWRSILTSAKRNVSIGCQLCGSSTTTSPRLSTVFATPRTITPAAVQSDVSPESGDRRFS
jgi:predicted alpha/beta-fold hydrolase